MKINDIIYGNIEVSGVIAELCNSKLLTRLKGIQQGGAVSFAYPNILTSRFEHSVGVCKLIELLGGSEKEQIAGLLHDISHTAFSHVIDYVTDNNEEDYHEKIKDHFFNDPELILILNKYGYRAKDFMDESSYGLLEQRLPSLCADRIDYTLRDLVAWEAIKVEEALDFIDSLVVHSGKIAVKTAVKARWFKDCFAKLNHDFFRDDKNIIAYTYLRDLLKSALIKQIINDQTFLKTDKEVLSILRQANDSDIIEMLKKLDGLKNMDPNDIEIETNIQFKDRVIDPEVLIDNRLVPLSKLD